MGDLLKKYLVYVIIGAVSLVVIYVLYKVISAQIAKAKQDAIPENAVAAAQTSVVTTNLTYGLTQFSSFADEIQQSLDALWKDQDAVISIFGQMQTIDDIKELIVCFGTRKPTSWFVFGSAANLTQWITGAFSSDQIQELNTTIANTGYKF